MRPAQRQHAFTLIEMLLVAVILVLAAGVMAPSMSRGYRNLELRASARELLVTIEAAAEYAVRERVQCRLTFSQGGQQFWIERMNEESGQFAPFDKTVFAEKRSLPRGFTLDSLSGEPSRRGERSLVLMPNGSRERSVIEIVGRGDRKRWLDSGRSLGAAKILTEKPNDV
jgi:type II secretion system protein H